MGKYREEIEEVSRLLSLGFRINMSNSQPEGHMWLTMNISVVQPI